jgi:hypothetical protein
MEAWSRKLAVVRAHPGGLGKQSYLQYTWQTHEFGQCCFEVADWRDHQIVTRNKACRNSTSTNMVQDKVTDDDIVSILDCVDENLSEVEPSDSDDEICDNQESDHRRGLSDSEQSHRQVDPVASG